jgi:purple acid phosphatase-like protein
MKKICLFVFTLALSFTLAQAQAKPKPSPSKTAQKPAEGSPQEEAAEKSVHITSGPNVTNLSPTSATIVWMTNKHAATDIHYGYGGGHEKIAYEKGGSTNHSVTLSGLKPNQNYTYKIMTREKEVRFQGTFHTPGK